jgi:hypothetical protein
MNEMSFNLEFVLMNDFYGNDSQFESTIDSNIDEFERNQLICYINNQSFDHLFERSDHIIGSINSYNDLSQQINSSSNGLFVCIKQLDNNSNNQLIKEKSFESFESIESIELIVSQQFLSHYNISVSDKHFYLYFIENCPKITKITIGVNNNDLYETVKSDKWSQKLLSYVSNDRKKFLCRRNDFLVGNQNLLVLNCEDILQGLLTLKTQIFVINISNDIKTNNNISDNQEINESLKRNEKNDNKMVNALNLMNFTSRLLLKPTFDNSIDGNSKRLNATAIQTYTASTSFLKAISMSFQIVILSNTPLIPDIDSENGCVFISNNALINKLKCNARDWVRIWLSSQDKTHKSKQRISQLYPIDSIIDDNIAYISPQLWFNLQTFPTHQFSNQPLIQPNITLMVNELNLNSFNFILIIFQFLLLLSEIYF